MLRDRLLTGFKLWGARRIERRTLQQATAGVTVFVLLTAWHFYAGAVTVLVAGVVYGRSRLQQGRARMPIRRGAGWWFGGQLLPLAPFTIGAGLTDEAMMAAQDTSADLILWIIAEDGAGHPWIRVQERPGLMLTATATGTLAAGADPFLESQKLALTQAGVSLADIAIVGWGTDRSGEADRRVVAVVGRTTARVDALGGRRDEGSTRHQLVEVHPESLARILTRVSPAAWDPAAVRGMVAALEMVYPNGRALLEELVEERWRSRLMFDRLNALTASMSERESQPVEDAQDLAKVIVLRAVEGVVRPVEERLRRANSSMTGRRSPNRSLSWESTQRTIPNRY